jgi:3-oxoacyl-[acyl-carrier protein] reductase
MATQKQTRTAGALAGKTCIVTGSSRGIGREIALQLGAAGADVGVNFHSSPDAASAVTDAIADAAGDGSAVTLQGDVSEFSAVAAMAADAREALGSVDVLVNNAGINVDRRFEEMTREEWHRVIDVNLNGAFNCTRAFYDDVRDAEAGRIVNVSSVIGQRGNYGQTNYAASKSALVGFTRSLARELAPSGTTVNCVAPGFTRTEMVESMPAEVLESIRSDVPLGRLADTEEVAAAVRFLADDDASYVTGEVLNVNGGLR